jgi:predicted nucleic acid-binding protein
VSIVVDASMTAAWLFADEWTEAALAVASDVTANGAVVPSLWRLEIANLLRTVVRRGGCDENLADALLERLESLPIVVDRETDKHAWHATRTLSRDYDLTPYDAAYLELAIRLSLPLATCDRELIVAAQRIGVPVVTP